MQARPRRQTVRRHFTMRALAVEPLEAREMLDGSPWQNPVFRLDVNNSGATTPSDALAIINRIRENGGNPEELPDPGPNPPQFYYDANGDNRLTTSDLLNVVNGILAPPDLQVSSLTPYTVDVTPLVTVTAAGTPAIADDTVLELDVDLNGDGDFGDPGEFGHSQSTFFAGSSTFQITPALPRTSELYSVNLRARVQDSEGVIGASPVLPLGVDTLTSTALADYVNTPDPSYSFSLFSTTPGAGFTYYVFEMTSQTWRSTAEVNLPVWRHWLQVYVPTGPIQDTAVLLIDGGRNTSPPNAVDANFGALAVAMQSVLVDLKTVPNEPVEFTDETRSRTEDAIIAYTFDKFMRGLGEPGNETWPLLLPMVKSAVRAMDTIQSVVPALKPGSNIDDFLVTGYSKRGWTTWLTAAVDDRVRAIIPGVFDNLNQGPQMVHHYGVYGFFSPAVDDYEELGIFTRLLTTEAQQLSPITDPYRYLTNGRFDDMPKLILNSPGDEFFVTDSAQFYINDIPGDDNHLRYIPNTGHGLDLAEVGASTLAFYDAVVNNRVLPDYSWTVAQNGEIHVQTLTAPTTVLLWQATNPVARDFRRTWNPGITWTSTVLVDQGGGTYVGDVPMPVDGATGYFVELTFDNPVPFLPDYVFTTEVRVKSTLPFSPWPFEVEPPIAEPFGAADVFAQTSPPAIPLFADPSAAAIASALSIESGAAPPAADAFVEALFVPAVREVEAASAAAWPELMFADVPDAGSPSDSPDEPLDEPFDSALESTLALLLG